MGPDLSDDAQLASYLAVGAGRVLLDLREDVGFGDSRQLKRLGDARAHRHLVTALARHRPGDAVLSEEGVDDPGRLEASRVWIVDPLDGTREFSEEGRTDWAVHVALWAEGRLTAGAVAIPARDTVLTTAGPPPPASGGASARTGGVGTSTGGRRLRLAVSRSRPPALTGPLAATLDAELVPMGSAGVKIAAVVQGAADAYVHAGGQYEWDSAAPVAVALAHGFHASRIDGSPLEYNKKGAWLPDLVVCRQEDRERLVAAIQDARTASPEEPS
nr:PAPS 3'-phosphatase [Streptomyces sp.]